MLCWTPRKIFLHILFFPFLRIDVDHVVIWLLYLSTCWKALGTLRSKLYTSVLLFTVSVIPIDRKYLLPNVEKLDSYTRVYYRVVADRGFREKRWQHRYDMGSLYLQSYMCESPFISYNSSQSVVNEEKLIEINWKAISVSVVRF